MLLQYPQGHWDLPKGHVEENDESKQHTASRELVEETGIDKFRIVEGFEYRTDYSFRRKKARFSKKYGGLSLKLRCLMLLAKNTETTYGLNDSIIEHATHAETKGVLKAAKRFADSK